jgi:anti-anti-sigma factor
VNFRSEISAVDRGVTRVALAGDLDIAAARALQQSLEGLIRRGHTRLVVDLTDVAFIDSTGLGILLRTNQELRRKRGGRLAVVCPDPAMRELFELVGHNMLFPVDDTLEKALLHVSPSRRFAPRRRTEPARGGSGSPPQAPR